VSQDKLIIKENRATIRKRLFIDPVLSLRK
jgi:hypothetical protein